jgi:DNA-binding transcriptional LysR family regulator
VDRTTVGRRLDKLERELGLSIFEQDEGGHRPTEVGRRALETAAAIEQLVERFVADAGLTGHAPAAPLRVAVAAELGVELTPQISAFALAHPELRLRLVSTPDPAEAVLQRRCDVALCLADRQPAHLRGRQLAQLYQAPYAASAYLDRKGWGLAPQTYEWIRCSGGSQHSAMQRWDAIFCDTVTVAAYVDSWPALRANVEAGLGAGFLWTFVARKLPDLQPIGPCDPNLSVGLWALSRDDVPLERSAREFMRQIHLASTPD